MNLTVLAQIAEKNPADLEAIVAAIGLPTLFKILPNVLNIVATLSAGQEPEPIPTGIITPAVAPATQSLPPKGW
jgi:hypothetical protein